MVSLTEIAVSEGAVSEVDIAIAGGGMAGLTLAWALLRARPTLRLAVIEQQGAVERPVSFDSRSIALAAASVQQLQAWQLWPELAAKACPIRHIHVSDRGHFGKCYLTAEQFGLNEFGAVLEVEHLGQLLQQRLQNVPQEQLLMLQPDHIAALQQQQDQVQLQLASGKQLSAALLVVCEGGLSPTRQLAGFALASEHYEQTAVIANLALAEPHQERAYERFTADGPIALLPLPGKRYSLVWTTSPEQAARLMQLGDSEFTAAAQQAFGYRAGAFVKTGARASYPLTLRRTDSPVRHRIALLGNSLHSLHPIAGQGFNLALRDIAALVQLVQQMPKAIGDYTMLRQYQLAREADMQQVMTLTDGLVRLFSNRSRLVALGRNLGLLGMLLCDELKQPLAHQAMGYSAMQRLQAQLKEFSNHAAL
ncbi:2-octaprenyl-6-methoxyphenyl hydroxylase [Alkalimonas amylolytica]|uniref:2-octaprenyl-6-methoxyphenol hydroxylase n=1 Tax=Alkalimonas amylolytica TaxID=152573 RepID=A0A1H4EUU9_ALKAM|nr:2-octaprenyl-6-methoxyphenyl hydroxylase [Alkalimonas amylolytica]SEA88706.1 2-octaprenyl-6-methoxyphenol hydroxylase [Alkalimonas amylolytica]